MARISSAGSSRGSLPSYVSDIRGSYRVTGAPGEHGLASRRFLWLSWTLDAAPHGRGGRVTTFDPTDMPDFRFNVSDAYMVPLRGWMLRLKLVEGDFDPSMLSPGSTFRLTAPDGHERTATVKGLSATAGKQTRHRVETYREFDIVIPAEDAVQDEREVGLGWSVRPA